MIFRGLLVTALIPIVLAGCSDSIVVRSTTTGATKSDGRANITVAGRMNLKDPEGFTSASRVTGSICQGSGGYSDLADGAEVVISDDAGRTLTIASLEPGTVGFSGSVDAAGTDYICSFAFKATVPAGKSFYGITVTHRGTVKFTEADMAAPVLSIGS